MRDIERKPFHKRLRHAGGEALTAPLNFRPGPPRAPSLDDPPSHMGKMPSEFKQSRARLTRSCFASTACRPVALSLPRLNDFHAVER
jgi:hypothetical protein